MYMYTRSARKVSGLPLYLRAIVFERPLRGMNVNSEASRTYRLLAIIYTILYTYSTYIYLLFLYYGRIVHVQRICLQSYF